MLPHPQFNEDTRLTMQELLCLAAAACAEIKRFQPDFIAVLLHGGWVVAHAALALWQKTEQAPFPPILPVNIGREKLKSYERQNPDLPFRTHRLFLGFYADYGEIGHFLNWAERQEDWIAWIRERVEQIGLAEQPVGKILILDDRVHEGSTFFLSRQLFETSFPKAEIHFLAEEWLEWRHSLSRPWLEQHQVALPEDHLHPAHHALWVIASGSTDIDPDSLDWQPVSAGIPELQPLAELLPLETWLELPGWIQKQIRQAAQTCDSPCPGDDWHARHFTRELTTVELLFRHLWRHGSINTKELAQIAGVSLYIARKELRNRYEWGVLVVRGSGKTRRYQLSPEYDLHRASYDHAFDSFWVIPGRLLSGDYLGWEQPESLEKLFAPLRSGNPPVVIELNPDEEELPGKIQALGIEYLPVPADGNFLDRAWMQQTLDILDEALRQQKTIYLTASSDSELGLVLGCFLVRQGMSGPAALRRLKSLHQHSRRPWQPFPPGARARKMIRHWGTAPENLSIKKRRTL